MDDMDRLLFSAAKDQTPAASGWEALRRRHVKQKRLYRSARQLAAGAAVVALLFLADRLQPPPEPVMIDTAPPADGSPVITVPKTDGEPEVNNLPQLATPQIALPKTDYNLLSVSLGEFSLPGLPAADSLLELDFTWLPEGWTVWVDAEGMAALVTSEDQVTRIALTLYRESYAGLLPGFGHCSILVDKDSGDLDMVIWTLRLKEGVWVDMTCDWISVQETLDFVQGIAKKGEEDVG